MRLGLLWAGNAVSSAEEEGLHLLLWGGVICLTAPWSILGVLVDDLFRLRYDPLVGSLVSMVLNVLVFVALANWARRRAHAQATDR